MTAPLSLDSRVVAIPDQLSSELSGEVVILSVADGVYYGLDAVGAHVWRGLSRPQTVQALVDDVMARFIVDRAACERDVLAFLEDLRRYRLLQVVSDDSA